MSEARDCVVKLVDNHGVEHSVRVRAESVYETALRGLQKLERVGWESTGEQIGWVTVEVWEEPTAMQHWRRKRNRRFQQSYDQSDRGGVSAQLG
jgi:hypothetical protein